MSAPCGEFEEFHLGLFLSLAFLVLFCYDKKSFIMFFLLFGEISNESL